MLRLGRVLLAGLVLSAWLMSSRVWAADPKYFPSDTEIVFSVNFKQILESELVKKNQKKVDEVREMMKSQIPPEALKYMKKAGFDPFKDFNGFTIAMPPSKEREAIFAMIEGNFNAEKLTATVEEIAKEQGEVIRISKVGRFSIYEITPPGEQKVYISLLSNNVMAICASEDNIKAAIARASGNKKSALKREIASLLQTVSNKQSVSFVATGSALAELAKDRPVPNVQALDNLKLVEGISGAVTISKDIQLQIGIATKDAATAKDFAGKTNTGINFLRFFINQRANDDQKFQPLAEAAKTLQATSQGSNLIIRGQITFENVQKLIENFNPMN